MPKLLDWIKNMGGVFNHISLHNGISFLARIKEQILLTLLNCTGDDLIDYKIYGNTERKESFSEASGNPINITDGDNTKRMIPKIIGDCNQNGNPSLSSPITINTLKSIGGKINFNVSDGANSQTIQLDVGNVEFCKLPDGTADKLWIDYATGQYGKTVNIRKIEAAIADMNNSEDYPGWKNQTQLKSDYPNKNNSFNALGISSMSNIKSANSGFGLNTYDNGLLMMYKNSFGEMTQSEIKENYPDLILNFYYKTPSSESIVLGVLSSSDLAKLKMYQGTNVVSINGYDNNGAEPTINLKYNYEPATPTPNFPSEIKALGDLVESGEHQGKYKIPVRVSTDNLFDNSRPNIYFNNQNVFVEYLNASTTDYIVASEEDEFAITSAIESEGLVIACFDGNKNLISRYAVGNGAKELIVRCPQGTKYIISSNVNYFIQGNRTELKKRITTNIYLVRPLFKIGDTADYIDFGTGKRHNFFGNDPITTNWTYFSKSVRANTIRYSLYNIDIAKKSKYVTHEWFCDRLFYTRDIYNYDVSGIFIATSGEKILHLSLNISDLPYGAETTQQQLKEYLSNNVYNVIYPLETPTEETIDLPEIPTFEGTTIIEIETETQPSNMWVKYYSN